MSDGLATGVMCCGCIYGVQAQRRSWLSLSWLEELDNSHRVVSGVYMRLRGVAFDMTCSIII